MTMKEKLQIHREIEESNARKLQEWKEANRACEFCRMCARFGKKCKGKTVTTFLQCFTA